MLIDPRYMIEKATSSDKSRPVLSCVHVDAENQVAVATDSYALVVVPCRTDTGDDGGLVPAEAIAEHRKVAKRNHGAAELIATNGRVELKSAEGCRDWPRPEGQFPDWQRLMPDPATEGPALEVAFSAELLLNVAKALGATGKGSAGVTLRLRTQRENWQLRPIEVVANGDPEARAILMPIHKAS